MGTNTLERDLLAEEPYFHQIDQKLQPTFDNDFHTPGRAVHITEHEGA